MFRTTKQRCFLINIPIFRPRALNVRWEIFVGLFTTYKMAGGFLGFVWKQNFRFSVTRYCRCYNTMNSCLCSLIIQRLFSKSKIHGAVSLPHSRKIVSCINASLKDDQRGSSFKQERQIVLLVSETGTSLGQTSFEKAKEIARTQHMELVWINKDNKADMAVFKLMRKGPSPKGVERKQN